MTDHCHLLGPLAAQFPGGGLFASWLEDRPILDTKGASVELNAALAAPSPVRLAPLWREPAFAKLLPPSCSDLPHGPSGKVQKRQLLKEHLHVE